MNLLSQSIPILIPAFEPGQALVELAGSLTRICDAAIIIVNDGSSAEAQPIFDALAKATGVHILRHPRNLGKGAALKTGLNYAISAFPECIGVVTADADGQHHPEDIRAVRQNLRDNPEALTLGSRTFTAGAPWRSRAGNRLTRVLMQLLVGQKLSDTQTGLRGIPRKLITHIVKSHSTGYEFELDMLIACKHQGCRIVEHPIRTIYAEGNPSSHFHPLLDSMRIYLLLFRFGVLSFLTAVLDNAVFIAAFHASGSLGQSQIAARFAAVVFNYSAARSVVFHSRQKHTAVFPKYLLLVICNALASYGMIRFVHTRYAVRPISAKIAAESLLFVASFVIQRDFVFTRRVKSMDDGKNSMASAAPQ